MTCSVVDHRTAEQFLLFIQCDKKTGIMFAASVTHLVFKTTSQNNCHIKGAVTCSVCITLRQSVFRSFHRPAHSAQPVPRPQQALGPLRHLQRRLLRAVAGPPLSGTEGSHSQLPAA